jgi:hypothetical protein
MQSECLDRLNRDEMEYYHKVYENSERWNGIESLDGKKIIIYCEQGFGDIIHFSRYFKFLKQRNCEILLHCPKDLHRLFSEFDCPMIDRCNFDIPIHDFHTLSMSLPFNLDNPHIEFPYLHISNSTDISEIELPEQSIKVGIAWEGNPNHSNNDERCCPLIYFKKLSDNMPNLKMFSLHKNIHTSDLVLGSEDMELYGADIVDFQDTAELIAAMDVIISVDTSVLHLAGALNKPSYGLLSLNCDPRWDIDINWYPSVKLLKQKYEDDWQGVFEDLQLKLEK